MIQKTDLNRTRLFDFVGKMKNIQSHLAQEDVATLGLETIQGEFVQKLTELEKAVKPISKNEHTATLSELDDARGLMLRGMIKFFEAYKNFPNEAKEKAGMKLVLIAKKYGKVPDKRKFNEETAIVESLLQDLALPENEALVKQIGAAEWVKALKEKNDEFSRVFNLRTNEYAGTEPGSSKMARKEMYDVFKKLVQTINALAFLQGTEKYERLIKNINQELEQ